MRFFELITFTVRVRTVADALARIEAALTDPNVGGTLMGCWASEIGQFYRCQPNIGVYPPTTVGAGLPAKAAVQPTSLLNVPPSSL
ncbi:NIPSNAP family protein [Pseudomonas fluorescens]|uniref:NIPSNAP family protein n=1 Tax=Pseudomonas fluorescens TaxID=294 RepID=A0A0P9BB75_PSEFL|nr:NIPSNAP family protein [Pseudomonas fluorescens]